MKTKSSILRTTFFLVALAGGLILAGALRAQEVPSSFAGKFTLASPVHWGKAILPPGTYSIRIDSTASPILAFISRDDSSSSFAIRVMSIATDDYHNGPNALRLKVRNGSLVVHSLVLANLDTVLIYDPSPDQETVEEAGVDRTVPVLVARK